MPVPGRWPALLVLLGACGLSGGERRFVTQPDDQAAAAGGRAALPCRVADDAPRALRQWTKDGFGLGNLSGFDRYSISGDVEDGDYTLVINPVTLEDDGVYVCQVGAGANGEPPIASRRANLSVLVPPEPPKIIQGSQLLTTEGREIELECVSGSGKPPSELHWIDGKGNLLNKGVENIVEPVPYQKTFSVRSILRLTPRREHHNTTFTCQAQSPADPIYHSTRLLLEVKYPPRVSLIIAEGRTRILEGQDVRFFCLTDANPPQMSYRWFINDQLRVGQTRTELLLKNVTTEDHNSVIKCQVTNIVGKTEEILTLDISYGPRFRVLPYSVQADPGASVTLSCAVDGNPVPNIVWIHEDSGRQGNVLTFTWEQVVSTSPNLTLTVSQETAGRYFCRATVPGFTDIKADATIYMKGPPTIISHRTQYGVLGDDVAVECSAFSIPTPQKVIWSFKGEDVGLDADYHVAEEPMAEGIKSTLTIKESRYEQFGIYNCTVSNPYGSDVVEIVLKAQKSFPVHSIVIGVMGGVMVILAVTVCCIICQQKSKKMEKSRMTGDLNDVKKQRASDRSSNLSDMKIDLRYSGEIEEEEEGESGSEGGEGLGLPLAGPVPLNHRYSVRLPDSEIAFLSETDGQNNSGYIPYVDYSRELRPPSLSLPAGVSPVPSLTTDVDPRFSAVYGNPYLRHSTSSQFPLMGAQPTPQIGLGAQPTPQTALLPPPYTSRGAEPNSRGSLATHV